MSKQTDRIKKICDQLDVLKLDLIRILVDKKTGINICHKTLREYLFIFIQGNLSIHHLRHPKTHRRLKGLPKSKNQTQHQIIRQSLRSPQS